MSNIKTQSPTRNVIELIAKGDHRITKFIENISEDVSKNLPSSLADITLQVEETSLSAEMAGIIAQQAFALAIQALQQNEQYLISQVCSLRSEIATLRTMINNLYERPLP